MTSAVKVRMRACDKTRRVVVKLGDGGVWTSASRPTARRLGSSVNVAPGSASVM